MATAKLSITEKLAAISSEIGGIPKSDENYQLKFKYRSIDTIMVKSTPLFAKYGVVIVPEVLSINIESRETNKGSYVQVAYTCELLVKYRFVSGDESIEAIVPAFSIDYSDKCAAQAMTAAYKCAILQVLGISSGDDQDSKNNEIQQPANGSQKTKANGYSWQTIPDNQFSAAILEDREWNQKINSTKDGKREYIIINDKSGNPVICIELTPAKKQVCQDYIDFMELKKHEEQPILA